ncbi:MAG: hypothetical protein ABR985_05470 [Methanotrichaceae archaeon]|jgi:ABC-type phosphate transport system substrate-binding protein
MGKKVGYLVVSLIMLSVAAVHAEIIVSGSTTVQPLAELWASEFNRLHQDYHISASNFKIDHMDMSKESHRQRSRMFDT